MKNVKRLLAIVLVLALALTCLPVAAMAEEAPAGTMTQIEPRSAEERGFKSDAFTTGNTYQYADDEVVRAIVLMDGSAAAEVETSKRAAVKATLANQHAKLRKAMTAARIDYTVEFEYDTLLNGMAVSVAYGDLNKIAAMSGVKAVHIANRYALPDDTINMDSANEMTGANLMHNAGMVGSGAVIAVIDTGLNVNHEAFQVYEGRLQSAAVSQTDAEAYVEEIGYGAYVSEKVPFAYDYADGDDDVYDGNGHGTHVSGIAAGYAVTEEGEVTFMGAAPDAQILAMKVFFDGESGTSSDVYFAALEDAMNLGADVINMSLGSQNGFTYDAELESEVFGNIYQTLEDNGIMCVVAAGNEGSQADGASNLAGAGYVTSDYTDYGTVGSPSTYDGNLSVASVENATFHTNVAQVEVEGETVSMAYNDAADVPELTVINVLGEKDGLGYVVIPNYGEAADFEGLNVEGKIAVIQRGGNYFSEKVLNAQKAGAIAAIVYDNKHEALFGMDLSDTEEPITIPAVSITLADGETLVSLLESNPAATVYFPKEAVVLDSDTGWQMSSFSSWGCTNDLTLKPQITGVGGNVWSADATTTDGYVNYSGTSMATPDVAGCYAALAALLKQSGELDKKNNADLIEAITESTAMVLYEPYEYVDGSGNPQTAYFAYSPRRQGAGLIDLASALTASAYILDPICNVGDNADGVFEINFTVFNANDEAATYELYTDVLCDYAEQADWGTEEEPDVHTYNTMSPDYLIEDSHYTITSNWEDNKVVVPAEGTADVTVTITLTDDGKEYLDSMFPNGAFVEGYVYLGSVEDDSFYDDMHATYLAYYGDWSEAPIMEGYDWRDVVDLENWLNTTAADDDGNTYADNGYTYLDAADFEINTDVSMAYAVNSLMLYSLGQIYGGYAGDNMYWYNENEYNEDRIAISTNPGAITDMLYMTPMNVRNVRHMLMVVTDADTGEVYSVDDTEYLPKAVYDTDNAAWSGAGSFVFDGTKTYGLKDGDFEYLPDGTRVSIDYYANLSFGEDKLGEIAYEDLKAEGQDYCVWSFGCTVDNTAPELLCYTFDPETCKLTLTVSENEYLANIGIFDADGDMLDGVGVEDAEPGVKATYEFDLSETYLGGALTVYLDDYATNETGYILNVNYKACDHGNVTEVEAKAASCDEEGNEAYWYCADCDKYFADEDCTVEVSKDDVIIPALYETCPSKAYTDLSQTAWYHEYVDYALANNLFKGTSDTLFEPDAVMTRAMLVTVLYRIAGEPDVTYAKMFSDVSESDWFAKAVVWAASGDEPVVNGVGGGKFNPMGKVTREETAAILYRYAKNAGYDVTASAELSAYPDNAKVSDWAKSAMSWAVGANVISGSKNANGSVTLEPAAGSTRAEVATMLTRFCTQFVEAETETEVPVG